VSAAFDVPLDDLVRNRPGTVRVRAKTLSIKRLSQRAQELARLTSPDTSKRRLPMTRAECPEERPCPHVTCKHHLAFDVDARNGSIKTNFPHVEVDELAESCTLDVADAGGRTLEDVAEAMNLTRERVRQLETKALAKVAAALAKAGVTAEDLQVDDGDSRWVNGRGESCGTPSNSSLGGMDPVRIAGGARR
jgi:predicted DNA-binding protein (UPF0251 family)